MVDLIATVTDAEGQTATSTLTVVRNAISNPLGSTGARSGLPWNSALWPYQTTGTTAGYTAAEKLQESKRGRLVDVVRGAQYYNQWQDLAGKNMSAGGVVGAGGFPGLQILGFLCDYANQTGGPIPSLMLPPWPNGIGGSWTAGASGAYDAFWQQMGSSVVALRPNGKTILEPAWEGNGSWYPWSAPNAADFKNGWNRCAAQMRIGAGSKAGLLVFCYTMSGLDVYAGGDPLGAMCPTADLYGTDTYDRDQVTTSDTVPAKAAMLQRLYDFCKANGKFMAIPEWGLHHLAASFGVVDGGDNPHFINAMMAWIRAHSDILAFENYFQDDAANNVNSGLFSPTANNNPNSTAAYLAAMK